MPVKDSDTLKSYFTLSKVPTPSNYTDLIDTIFEKSIIGSISTEHLNITDTAIQLKDGDTIYTELAGGSLTLGLITEDHILVASSGIRLQDDTVVKIDLQADGDVFIGEDVSAASTTFMSIFSNTQIYNEELISAGDVLLGDNSASKANILWDKSEGKLLFRGGTSAQVEINTTGALSAGSGAVILNSDGLSLDAASGLFGAGSINWWQDTQRYLSMGMITNLGNPVASYLNSYLGIEVSISSYDEDFLIAFEYGSTSSKFRVSNGDGWIANDVRIGYGLYVGDHSQNTDPGDGEIIVTNKVYINDTSNSKVTQGLTINQGANDDEILAFKSSDVAHGITTVTETDTYATFQKNSGTDGGLRITGIKDTGYAGLVLYGIDATGATGKTSSSVGSVVVIGQKANGTGVQALGSTENIFAARNDTSAVFIIGANGDIWSSTRFLVNDDANAKSTKGLTINQGTATDEAISFKNSDVAHGVTDTTETDTYGFIAPVSADGGIRIRGLTEVTDALNLYGIQTTEVTSKATNAGACITLTGGKKSGTGPSALGADANIVRMTSHGNVKHIFDADGDIWYIGSLQSYKNSTTYTGYIFVPLTTPITNTDWNGDDTKTTGTYNIDLSAWDVSLTGVKAVLVRLSGHFTTAQYEAALKPRGSSYTTARMMNQVANVDNEIMAIIPTDTTNFDIDVVITGGSMTQSLLEIWGYWI